MATDAAESFDLFEVLTALLLGLAATATALVSHENGLWGGKSTEAYGESATLTSKASNLDNSAVVEASQDANVEIEAKRLIREASRAKNDDEKEEAFALASYLLTDLLSDAAYKGYQLPQDYREGKKTDDYLPEDVLTKFLEMEGLGQEYTDALFSEGEHLFDEADKIFQNGRDANDMGDKFSFSAVLYAISLFFAGISSVLKSKVRWIVLALGAVIFVASSAYAATLSWSPIM
jgi:hypothetical protein